MSERHEFEVEDACDLALIAKWDDIKHRMMSGLTFYRTCSVLSGGQDDTLDELEATAKECFDGVTTLLNERHNAVLAKIKAEMALEDARIKGFPLGEMIKDPLFMEGYSDGRAGKPIQSHAPRYIEGHQEGMIRQPTRI